MKKLTAIAITLTAIGVAVKVSKKKSEKKPEVKSLLDSIHFQDFGWSQ